MTERITINGKNVFEGTITAIESNCIRITISTGQQGVLFPSDISENYINPKNLFTLNSSVFVRIKNRCFDGTLIFTMEGILSKSVNDYYKGEEMYCISVANCKSGTIVQITPSITALVLNTYLEKGTMAIASVYKTDTVTNRMCLLLDSVLYDRTDIKLDINYGNILTVTEENKEIAA